MRTLMLAAAFIPTLSSAINAAPLDSFQDCDLCPVMIELPLGDFTMGAPDNEFRRNLVWYDGAYRPATPEHQFILPHEGPVWMAPALQAFSGDICGLYSQNSRVSGLFMFRHCLHWP